MIELAQRQELILNFPCFAKLNRQDALELAQMMTEVSYHEGDIIVIEETLIDAVYLIAEGIAEVTHNSIHNKQKTKHLMAILQAGESIGLNELGFFSKTHFRTATVTAATDMVLLHLSISQLNTFFHSHPYINDSMVYLTQQMLRAHFIKYALPFIKLSKERISWLTQRVTEITLKKNEIIFNEGDKADNCYLICSGQIEIYTHDKEKNKHDLAILTATDLFGETALLTSTTRNASARAIEPCTLLVLHKKDFIELITREKTTTDTLTEMIYERGRFIINPHIIINQYQTNEEETITNLKNPIKHTYYQLSKEGWFLYQRLDGKHTLFDLKMEFNKNFNISESDFIYDLIVDLVKGGFVSYSNNTEILTPSITIIDYNAHELHETMHTHFKKEFPPPEAKKTTWIHVQGLHDIGLIVQLGHDYHLHPLTIEDILNTKKRPGVEIFDHYVFITLKALTLNNNQFTTEQISIVFGNHFVLSFQENKNTLFDTLKNHLHTKQGQHIREHGTDYLTYRLIDLLIEQYFVVLEKMHEQIEELEELILTSPTSQNSRYLYRFKRKIIILRKIIWPVRETISQLLLVNDTFITASTTLYLRGLYDHIAQAIDTLETYREMLAGILDAYLSSLSTRMNEIMKVLTIISTTFIPLSFIAAIFGMNFIYMPIFYSHWGFPIALSLMCMTVIMMLLYFKHKKWL